MMLKDLVLKNRTRRRFYEDESVSMDDLKDLVDLARLTPSANNLQPLKYLLSHDKETNQKIFRCLKWAGYLKNWDAPAEGERPAAYIVMLHDKAIRPSILGDDGIVAQTIMLGAVEKGLGGCMLGAVDKKRLRVYLNIPMQYEIVYVLALGKPREEVVIDEMQNDQFKYWRDGNDVHHVPKRSLNEVIVHFDDPS